MAKMCVLTPGVNKDLSGEPSALHSDLVDYLGDRDLANAVYAAVKAEGLDMSKLEYDKNGEPTIESVARQLPLRKMVKESSLSVEKEEVGAIDEKGNQILYDSIESAKQRIGEFNDENPDLIAYPVRQDKKFAINVSYKNEQNYQKPQEVEFNSRLHNSLLGIMRSLGFTAITDDSVEGIFDPLNALETANGLKAVIRVAKGERGENAFTEEYSHLMIEGLQNHPLVIRILNSLRNEEAIRRILGEDYDRYSKLYTENGRVDMDRMAKEAAGKLLQRYIEGEDISISPAPVSLFTRLWNFIKSLFSRVDESDIDRLIQDINDNTVKLASLVTSEDVISYFDGDSLVNAKALYKVSAEVDRMEQIANTAYEVASRRLKLLQSRAKGSAYSKDDIRNMKRLQEEIEKKKYASSCTTFLKDTLLQLKSLQDRMKALEDNAGSSDVSKLAQLAQVLRKIKEFSDGYSDVVDEMMRMESLQREGDVQLSESNAKEIASKATKVALLINELKGKYITLRRGIVYQFFNLYWSGDKKWNIGSKKGQMLTLSGILDMADRDISSWDSLVGSLSDASDPLLSLFDLAVRTSHAKRDTELERILMAIRGVHRKLINAGETSEFMYEMDENGIPTGRIISNINFAKYEKDRREFIDSLKKEGKKYWEIKSELEKWENKHTENKTIEIDEEKSRTIRIPKSSKESSPYYIDRLSKLNDAQREYYDAMMKLKARLERAIPDRFTDPYRAVQISNDLIEGLSRTDNPKEAVKMLLSNVGDKFLKRTDDTEFGEKVEAEEGEFQDISLDFSNKPIQKLPVYYVRKLKDMRRLSTDFTGSMLAYAGMAVDYGEMSKIVDILEVARDFIHDRNVRQYSGNKILRETFKVLHKEFGHEYTIKGGKIAERLDAYMDSVVYGHHKKDEGSIDIAGEELSVSKTIDSLKSYSGAIGLGLNLFSAISNVTVGKMQIWIDAMSKEYFGPKNAVIAKKNYYILLKDYLGEVNSTTKSNKLALLIDKYDALEEFYSSTRAQGTFKGSFNRIMQNTGLYILNNLGEHYLHSRTMLAMLDRQKVKVNGREKSLFEAWKVMEVKDDSGNVMSHQLILESGTTDTDGNELFTESHYNEIEEILNTPRKNRTKAQRERLQELYELRDKTDSYNEKMKMRIGKVNQTLNGAFNEIDRGTIHRYSLGRLAMQFRQWMPAHYSRRFASAYYDATLDQFREGYYRTLGRFTLNLIKDLKYAKFQVATRWRDLSEYEKRNMIRAGAELSIFTILTILCGALGHWKDRKGNFSERLALYNLKRMKLEAGASIPWPLSPDFIPNLWTILQSPAAAMKTAENLTNLLQFQNMFNEIQSGKYRGWSEYERDLVRAIPIIGQVKKVIDLSEENYMFNIFDN